MLRSMIGGYQGPVTVTTLEDEVIAEAACRYRAEEDAAGVDRWQGRLHRIRPREAITPGVYRLKFGTGRSGEITVAETAPDSEVVHFEGHGDRPL